jgi:hypothetical protein
MQPSFVGFGQSDFGLVRDKRSEKHDIPKRPGLKVLGQPVP